MLVALNANVLPNVGAEEIDTVECAMNMVYVPKTRAQETAWYLEGRTETDVQFHRLRFVLSWRHCLLCSRVLYKNWLRGSVWPALAE